MAFMDWIKKNWVVILLVVLLIFVTMGNMLAGTVGSFADNSIAAMSRSAGGYGMSESLDVASGKMAYYPSPSADFSPEAQQRMIEKTSSLSSEVKRGTYSAAENQLKSVVRSSNGYILSENVNTYDVGLKQYKSGYYNIKVETAKYNDVLSSLKMIGEVKSFNENAEDITNSFVDLKTQLEAEKEKLKRYNDLYVSVIDPNEKINLINYIFDEERTIKYMEQSLTDMGNRVSYSTIYFSMTEKRSEYADIIFVKVSELIKTIVGSVNALLLLLFALLPWLLALAIIIVIVKLVRRKKRK